MSYDRFDFNVASLLIQLVESAASAIDIKNGQIEKNFEILHGFFRDEGYDKFEREMKSANKLIEDIIIQLHEIGKNIEEYSQRLQDEA